DPELPGIVLRLLQNPAMAALDMDTEDMENLNETQVQFVLMTANLLIKQADYSYEQWIGADDQYMHKMVMTVAADIDLSLLGENTGMESVVIDGAFSVEIDQINTATMDAISVPTEYLPLDDTDNFLFGDVGMIEDELQLGQTFSGSFTDEDDEQDIFSITLTAGQPVVFDLQSEDYPYLYLYGPDGFLVEEFDLYESDTHPFTAEQDGVYIVKVQAYWDLVYDLTVRP
ncbi:MAG: PPC domain-containing protein, partial [Chloroflexi bacterium]|nr:PPC domain-containing protein [Chloroflexota bacterium]